MPASSIDFFNMQDAKNNFNAMRPAPICDEHSSNQLMGHCQNVHVSRNCYYGYHDTKSLQNVNDSTDCEMKEVPQPTHTEASPKNARKRCADYCAYPQSKRSREEVQREKIIVPETTENSRLESSSEDLLEELYWNLHGGHVFHLAVFETNISDKV